MDIMDHTSQAVPGGRHEVSVIGLKFKVLNGLMATAGQGSSPFLTQRVWCDLGQGLEKLVQHQSSVRSLGRFMVLQARLFSLLTPNYADS